jgi:hypothetical protein
MLVLFPGEVELSVRVGREQVVGLSRSDDLSSGVKGVSERREANSVVVHELTLDGEMSWNR